MPPGYCAFEDDGCASGLSFAEQGTPEALAGACVEYGEETATDTSGPSEATTTSTGPDSSSSADVPGDTTEGSSSTGTPCPDGLPCAPSDPCATAGLCEDGVCVPSAFVTCDAPPSPCFGARGVCVEGECSYLPTDAQTPCEDGDACTVGDSCDGQGVCLPGPECPSDDPCQESTCGEEGCVDTPVADGSSCGPDSKDRCCGGTCVDISTDTDHCGGCGTSCAAGLDCEPVDVTSTCDLAPANTSGRCRCQGANAQCPHGQLCRTYTPFTNRCVPAGNANCTSDYFSQNSCPSFCAYE